MLDIELHRVIHGVIYSKMVDMRAPNKLKYTNADTQDFQFEYTYFPMTFLLDAEPIKMTKIIQTRPVLFPVLIYLGGPENDVSLENSDSRAPRGDHVARRYNHPQLFRRPLTETSLCQPWYAGTLSTPRRPNAVPISPCLWGKSYKYSRCSGGAEHPTNRCIGPVGSCPRPSSTKCAE